MNCLMIETGLPLIHEIILLICLLKAKFAKCFGFKEEYLNAVGKCFVPEGRECVFYFGFSIMS